MPLGSPVSLKQTSGSVAYARSSPACSDYVTLSSVLINSGVTMAVFDKWVVLKIVEFVSVVAPLVALVRIADTCLVEDWFFLTLISFLHLCGGLLYSGKNKRPKVRITQCIKFV